MFMIILIHLYVFWWVPITGNIQLYATPLCQHDQMKYYQCKNFHNNFYL